MKKTLTHTGRWFGHVLLATALVFVSIGAAAQTANHFGLKAGASWTNLRGEGEDVSDKDMRVGFRGGVFGRFGPNEDLGVQAELLYSQKGTRVTYDDIIDQEATFKLSYIELPVFAAVGIGEIPELHAGVYASYLVSSSVSTAGDLGNDEDELDRDNFQGADHGVLLGAGPTSVLPNSACAMCTVWPNWPHPTMRNSSGAMLAIPPCGSTSPLDLRADKLVR